MTPAIIVVTYNRVTSLRRLLKSIEKAHYPHNDIPLIISIDGGAKNQNEIVNVAESFNWNYGTKRVINHKKNLGLKNHILSCADLSEEYGSVIILEDDVFVCNQFYNNSKFAAEFYNGDDKIAGIGLYSYKWNIHANFPFNPIKENYDVYFMQYPASWGQCWTQKQWQNFRKWLENDQSNFENINIPENVKKWPESSWLKYFVKYLVQENKYFVYPYYGYTTNFSDKGTHNKKLYNTMYQVPLIEQNSLNLIKFTSDTVMYDAFFEIHPDYLKNKLDFLKQFDFEVDLYNTKAIKNINTKYFLSTKYSSNPITQYSYQLKPHEQNILYQLKEPPLIINLDLKTNFHPTTKPFEQQDYYYSINGVVSIFKYLIKRIIRKIFK